MIKRPSSAESARFPPSLASKLKCAADLNSFLDALEEVLARCDHLDAFFIILRQDADNTLQCLRVKMPTELVALKETYSNYAFPAEGENPNVIALRNNETVSMTAANLSRFQTSAQLSFERLLARHILFQPIAVPLPNTRGVGTLMLVSQSALFSASDRKFFQRLSDEIAPSLRLHLELATWKKRELSIRDTEAELQSLLRFVAEMSNLTTNSEIYQRIQQEFIRRFDVDLAAIFLANQHQLRCVDTALRNEASVCTSEWQARSRHLFFTRDISDGATCSAYLNNHLIFFGDIPSIRGLTMSVKDRSNLDLLPDLLSFGILPIRKQGNPIGVLWLGSIRRRNALSVDQLVLAQHLCDFLGAVIENANTYTLVEEQRKEIETLVSALQNRVEVLDRLASRDRLTGLYNYGSFEGELNKRLQIHHTQPQPSPLSLIMCDVDFFKRFNDTFGHVAGNVVLQEVANRICSTVRDNDYVARYGGEEFAILLNRCNLEAAARLAERIRDCICGSPFIVDGQQHPITLSLGCAELQATDDLPGFIARADTALYAAKQNGRNRVEISK